MAGLDRMGRQPVALLWDIENCPVPNDVRPEDVAVNICMALKTHPIVGGPVTIFSAYGDFNQFPRKLREGCQRTGVNLIDVPSGRKDAADKAILVDLFLFAIDHPPPSTIFLISGDVDFSAALHKLSQRGYTVVLAHGAGTGQGVSLALSNAASCVWQWPALARGHGLVPAHNSDWPTEAGPLAGPSHESSPLPPFSFPGSPAFAQGPPWARSAGGRSLSRPTPPQPINAPQQRLIPTAALLRSASTVAGSPVSGGPSNAPPQSEGQGDPIEGSPQQTLTSSTPLPEAARRGAPWAGTEPDSGRGFQHANGGNSGEVGGSLPVRSLPLSSADGEWARPGDLQGLKAQLVDLLQRNGGRLDLVKVPTEYRKVFGRPLFLSEYGEMKLTPLLVRIGDPIAVSGTGLRKSLHFARTRGPRSTHVTRHPPQPQPPGFSSEELSSSGEGEDIAQQAVKIGGERVQDDPGKITASESKVGGSQTSALAAVREESKSDAGRADESRATGSTTKSGLQAKRNEDDVFASLITMDQLAEDGLGASRTGRWELERGRTGSAKPRRSAERIDVVDLLSGEALEPHNPELWSFEEHAPPRIGEKGSLQTGDKSMGRMAWPSGEESLQESDLEVSVSAEEEVGEHSEDEEQAGWRERSRRGSSLPGESQPGRQPAAYWELLRKKGQASDSGGEQKRAGTARRAVRRRGANEEAGAVVLSDGDTSPGTPEIVERR